MMHHLKKHMDTSSDRTISEIKKHCLMLEKQAVPQVKRDEDDELLIKEITDAGGFPAALDTHPRLRARVGKLLDLGEQLLYGELKNMREEFTAQIQFLQESMQEHSDGIPRQLLMRIEKREKRIEKQMMEEHKKTHETQSKILENQQEIKENQQEIKENQQEIKAGVLKQLAVERVSAFNRYEIIAQTEKIIAQTENDVRSKMHEYRFDSAKLEEELVNMIKTLLLDSQQSDEKSAASA